MDRTSSPRTITGSDRELEIYQLGLTGQQPATPVSLARLEQKAKELLKPEAYDYVAGAAGGELTARANLEAFYRWRIVPRMLRNVSQRDLSVKVLGLKLPGPVLLGPVGVQGIVHRDAEVASGRAAASLGVPFVLSTVSSRSIEEVAQAMGSGARWFQLYWGKDQELTASMVKRAENSGYGAVVVTLDTSMLAWRERDLGYPYLPFLLGQGLANYFTDPVFRAHLPKTPEEDPAAAIRLWGALFSNTNLTWQHLHQLREYTRLPILLKGILHPDDARKALEHGADGILVSNHGGRQVDGAIAALDALPGVVKAAGDRVPVLFDSGIRRGADVVKAMALGASAVLIARPYIWGLAVAGEQGVREVLLNLLADTDLTLALSGHTSFEELDATALAPAGY
ncbi:MAG: lactate 2-monooxygenase [Acidobacteriia bacterium]|nr:lactate 2-monooxygenase [Terriglobia bacterium]